MDFGLDNHVAVLADGTVVLAPKLTAYDAHRCVLIVVKDEDGRLLVWKDREGERGVIVTAEEAHALARDRAAGASTSKTLQRV